MRLLSLHLKGTIEYGVVFLAGFEEDGVMSGQAEADFAGDLTSSRSTSGGYLMMHGPNRYDLLQQFTGLKEDFYFYWTSQNLCFGESGEGRRVDSPPCFHVNKVLMISF